MTGLWSKPLDVGDRICLEGDDPQDHWLRIRSLIPGDGGDCALVNVMNPRGQMDLLDAAVARAHRVDGVGR